METRVGPLWLIWAALVLTLGGAFCFTRGWLGAGLALLVAVDAAGSCGAGGSAMLRLRPLADAADQPRGSLARSGLALIALGWWETRHGSGWGAMLAAIVACAFAEAARIEKRASQRMPIPGSCSRDEMRSLRAVPFAPCGCLDGLSGRGPRLRRAFHSSLSSMCVHRLRSQLTTKLTPIG